MVQDAVTGEVLFDRSGDAVRVPASNMKLLTAVAALRTLGPERRFSTTAVAGAAPGSVVLTGGGDVLLGAGESAPDAVLGRAGLASLAQATVRALQDDGVSVPADGAAGRFPLHRPRAEPRLEPGGRCRRRGGSAVPAGTELGPLRPRQDHRPPPPGRRDERRRGVLGRARGRRRRGRADGGAGRRAGSRRIATRRRNGGQRPGRVLAEVQSATVGQQVDLLLRTSDNYLTEAIGRMAAARRRQARQQRGRRRGRAAAARSN